MSVRTKFNQQSDEDEQYSEDQSHHQFAKTPLLFLVQAAKLDRHSGRQLHILGQLVLNLPDRCAEVLSFQASGNRDHLAQVLTGDLSLALLVLNVGHLIKTEQLPRSRTNLQGAYLVERSAHVSGKDYAHPNQAVLLQN